MNITVYDNFKKAVNSTKQPSGGRTISVRLKDNCSVVNPVFRLKSNDKDINYVKWDNNYYNVDNVEFLANEEIAVHCTRDAMATFKGDIGDSTQYIARSASAYNSLICDNKYPTYNVANSQTLLLSGLQNQISTQGTIVMGIINSNSNKAVTYYAFNPAGSDFQNFIDYMFSGAYLDSSTLGISQEMQKELFNPIQYIASCMWFPIPLDYIDTYLDYNMKFGWWSSDPPRQGSGISETNRVYSEIIEQFHMPRHPQASSLGDYMNGAPFTRYTLHCWGFGDIPLDAMHFVANDTCIIQIHVDLYTGSATLHVITGRGATIATQSVQFGVPMQLSQITQNLVHGAVTTIASATSAVTSFAAGNVVGGALGIANGIVNAIDNAMPQVRNMGSNGSKVQFSFTPEITCEYYYQTPHDVVNMGRPLMESRRISSLRGYIECCNVDLITSATPEEKNEIIRYMTSGFFYE